ncbi:hypothetical protein KC336_g14451, partial [Hortaea werneckii]
MKPLLVGCSVLLAAFAKANRNDLAKSYGFVIPKTYALGTGPELNESSSYNGSPITLCSETPYVTLDFDNDVAGFPSFVVMDITEPAEVEVKYAEQYVALPHPESDGPWTFSNGLSNSFRVERFSLTKSGLVESFFVQGAQRWMSIELLSNSSVTFDKVGFEATSAHSLASELPAQLNTSNPTYDSIWSLGARAAEVSCVDAGNAPSTWQVEPEGTLIRGQAPAQSVKGLTFENYTMKLSAKIVQGGIGWTVASGRVPYGAKFYLTTSEDS